jgi:hypothetical protein
VVHLVGKNFGRDPKLLNVTLNGQAARFSLEDPKLILVQLPASESDGAPITVKIQGRECRAERKARERAALNALTALLEPGQQRLMAQVCREHPRALLAWAFVAGLSPQIRAQPRNRLRLLNPLSPFPPGTNNIN